jgi:hypothetical protein
MAFTPDLPFPKNAGDPIKSKDWNDLVVETKRLDTAKVERAGDIITGPLTVAGALRVNDSNLYLRGGSDANHGLGWFGNPSKQFAGANVDGPVLWGNLGGALGTAPGGAQKIALAWDGNGNVAIGVPSTTLKVDIGDRIRLRQGPSGDAGLWLYQTAPAEDRAFVGMSNDNTVGFYGNKGAGWSLSTDVTSGAVGVRVAPYSQYGMYLNPAAVGAGSPLQYGLVIGGGSTYYGLYVSGRSYDQSLRTSVRATNSVNTASTSYVNMPNMSLTFSLPPNIYKNVQILVQINGVQAQNSNTIGAYFQLVVDGVSQDATRHEFNHNGWELRGISLGRILSLAPGSHTITVQWAVTAGGLLTCCWYGDSRQIMVVEL